MVAVNYDWDEIEDNIDEEYDDSGSTVAEYTTEPYLYGDLISQYREGQSRFYCYDVLGSTLALTDSAGNVTDTSACTAFGEMTDHTGSTVNPFQYVGQKGYFRDEVTGEYFVRLRPLIARLARWLTMDMLGFIDGPNVYPYASNNPTQKIDPSGAREKCCVDQKVAACVPTPYDKTARVRRDYPMMRPFARIYGIIDWSGTFVVTVHGLA